MDNRSLYLEIYDVHYKLNKYWVPAIHEDFNNAVVISREIRSAINNGGVSNEVFSVVLSEFRSRVDDEKSER